MRIKIDWIIFPKYFPRFKQICSKLKISKSIIFQIWKIEHQLQKKPETSTYLQKREERICEIFEFSREIIYQPLKEM